MLILSMAMVSVSADPQLPKLFIDPPIYTAALIDEIFSINVKIANVTGLATFEFKLGYNTTLLDAVDALIGPFPPNPEFAKVINEPEGYVLVYVMCSPVDGNGTLATITFKTTYAGSASCALDLYDTVLGDASGDPIVHDVEGGNYEFAILNLTVATDKPTYTPGENLEIHGNLTAPMDGSPSQGLVVLEVDDPINRATVVRTLQTGPTPPPGDVSIIGVVPCDMWGDPKSSFKRGATTVMGLFYVKVTVKNNGTEDKNVMIIANTYDSSLVPLGVGKVRLEPLPPSSPTSLIWPIPIEDWASLGTGKVYVNVFTDSPKFNGIPYCSEENATFEITNGGQGATAPETQGSGNAGNYNLTFRLANNTMAGVYRIYASSFYKGQPVTNNTVVGVNAIYVSPDHYPTIQGAVDAATPTNNSILVFPGTYNEHVIINKSVTLVGIDPSNTTIIGSGTGTVVTVTANNVEISRFTIQNGGGSFPDSGIALNNSGDSTIRENTILENYNGVYLNPSSQNNIIWGNTITSNNGYGINMHSSDNNEILDNTVSGNNYGIYLNHSTGTTLRDNDMICNKYNFGVFGDSISDFTHDIDISNTVEGKPIIYWINRQDSYVPYNAGFVAIVNSTEIAVRGLDLTKNGQGVLFAFTNDSLIERVNTINNEYGIYLIHSYSNTIIGSAASNNSVGIYQKYSNGNLICHNNFINNTNQVNLYQSSNTWNDDTGKGNYWSNYTGLDDGSDNRTAGDGVGDTLLPHQGVDWYPLMNPWILVNDVAVTNVTTNVTEVVPYIASYVNVTVTAKNKGDFTETFHIIAYWNETNPIGMKQIIGLTPQKETALDLTWNTTGVSPGNYTISANASEVFGETYLDDNIFIDGNVTVLEPTIHDVAIVSVTPSATKVNIGYEINVTVVAKNEGHFTETFNVTAYYANATIEIAFDTKTVTLLPLTDTTLILTWNTTGVALGNYNISAEAAVVSGENNTTNNILTDGTVEVILYGDVNGDGKVNVLDVKKVKLAYSGFILPPDPVWYRTAALAEPEDVLNVLDVKKMKQIYSGIIV